MSLLELCSRLCVSSSHPPNPLIRRPHVRAFPALKSVSSRRQLPQVQRRRRSAQAGDGQVAESVPESEEIDRRNVSSIPKSMSWELDFCSRPMVDVRGKKVWEVLICNEDRTFEYSEYFPSNKINSKELANSIEQLLAQDGAVKPKLIRFFRGQMSTIITRALNELDIAPVPSRRCFSLYAWMEERLETVYKKDPRYSAKTQNLFMLDLGPPKELADTLRGEAWNFVQLPLGTLIEEVEDIKNGEIFGVGLPLEVVGLEDLPMDTLIPGVSIYSRRAEPLAAWTNSLEISNLKADVERACIILETGVGDRWKYAAYERSQEMDAIAAGWEQAKAASRGLHFIVVQDNPDTEGCEGLWLLKESQSKL